MNLVHRNSFPKLSSSRIVHARFCGIIQVFIVHDLKLFMTNLGLFCAKKPAAFEFFMPDCEIIQVFQVCMTWNCSSQLHFSFCAKETSNSRIVQKIVHCQILLDRTLCLLYSYWNRIMSVYRLLRTVVPRLLRAKVGRHNWGPTTSYYLWSPRLPGYSLL